MMKTHAWATLLVSALTAILPWLSSPWLTGHREPWDADGSFYIVALVATGALAGLLAPRPLWAHYLGAFIGQLGYEIIFLRVGPLFVLGALFLVGYCVIFVVAAAMAGYLRARLDRRAKSA